jgi:hypothetical protein
VVVGHSAELPGVGHFEPIDPRSEAWAAVAARA